MKHLKFILISLSLLILAGCGDDVPSFTLQPESLQLNEGETGRITVVDGVYGIVWSSSNTSVATISNGLVKAVSGGEAVITASLGDYSTTCKVFVKGRYTFTLSAKELSLAVGDSCQLRASDSIQSWVSNADSVASVSATGLVRAHSEGQAAIVAMTNGITRACIVTVTRKSIPYEPDTIKPADPDTIKPADPDTIKPADPDTVTPGPTPGGSPVVLDQSILNLKVGEFGTIKVQQNAANVVWTTSDSEVATVTYGVVVAKAIGRAVITATNGSYSASCIVYVSGTDGATLRLTPALVSLQRGETYTFQYGNTYALPVTFSSSDDAVATIDQNGQVTAVGPGNATITLATAAESVKAIVAVAHNWGDYTLVWSDEFNGTELDASNWNVETGGGGWGNNELQFYTNRSENLRVAGGNLEIEARLEAYQNRNYTSARLQSRDKQMFTYGKMEARIKFPGGKGTWPAFWSMAKGSWPACGEIDIIEHIGSQPTRASFALHTTAKNGSNGKNWNKTQFFDESLADDFHVYGVEWCKEEADGKDCIRFYIDGVVYATVWETTIDDNATWPFNKPNYLILNMAIGGNMGGTVDDGIFSQPRIMYVDWVRVYQRQEVE